MSLQDPQNHSGPSAASWSRNIRRSLALVPGPETDYEGPVARQPEDIVGPMAPR